MKTKLLKQLREEAETESLWATNDFEIYCRHYKRWIRAYILRRVRELKQKRRCERLNSEASASTMGNG